MLNKLTITLAVLLVVLSGLMYHISNELGAERAKTAQALRERDEAVVALRDQEKRTSAAIRASQRALQTAHNLQEKSRAKLEEALAGPARTWAAADVPDSVVAVFCADGMCNGPATEASAPASGVPSAVPGPSP